MLERRLHLGKECIYHEELRHNNRTENWQVEWRHIAEYLPDLIEINDMIYVFDGVEEPETYGAQSMIFDYPDPNWVPPTTSTTTTTVPAPTTSAPPSTTATAG